MTVSRVSPPRRELLTPGLRRLVAMVLGAVSFAWPLNLGVPLGPSDALRISDLMCALVLAAWWLSGMRVGGSRMVRALLVSGLVMSLGLPGVAGRSDLVFVMRLAEVPLIAAAAVWFFDRALYGPWLIGIGLGTAALGALLVYEGWVARTQGWVGLSRFDLLVSSVVPKEKPGFVFQAGSLLRASGTFDHPNAAAGVLALGSAVALVGWLALPGARRGRLLPALLLAPMAAGMLVSGSRGAVVAAIGGAAFSGILAMQQLGWRRLAGAAGLLVCAIAAQALVGAAAGGEYVRYLGTIGQGVQAPSVQGRLESWRAAASLILDHPLSGAGRDGVLSRLPATHNAFLFVAASSGVPLALLLVLCTAVVFTAAVRATRSSDPLLRLCSVATITAALLSLFEDRTTDPTFMSLLAFAAGPVLVRGRHRCPRGRSAMPGPPAQPVPRRLERFCPAPPDAR